MNAELKTGGPAFPDGSTNPWGVPEKAGMTLRDYFAAKVVQGLFSSGVLPKATDQQIARAAYDFADAMLEVRK
jgi:hypothetical protein